MRPGEPLHIDLGGSRPDVPETVVHSRMSDYHRISVIDIGYRRILQFERNRQSSMYLDDVYETDFEYPGYFHVALALRPSAVRTLVIGLGGGTVVKRMWRDYPDMRIDVVELDFEVADIAATYFALPEDPRIRVIVDEGRHFVETTSETYDIIIVDAFDDDTVPLPLRTEEFLRAARDRLREGGVIAYNVIGSLKGDRSKTFRALHRALANTWRRVWVFNVDESIEAEGNNIVLFASDTPLTDDELCERIADRVGGRVSVPGFRTFGQHLYTGPIRSGDVRIPTDAPSGRRGRGRR